MFKNIIDQFLYYPEDEEFLLWAKPLAIIMKTATGIDAAGAADLLEEIVDGRFQPEILKGGRHQAMGDIADQLDGIVYDLLGIINALQLVLMSWLTRFSFR